MTNTPITSYVEVLSEQQIMKLKDLLLSRCWEFSEAPHAHWKAKQEKTGVVAYKSGKLTVQGKGTHDFVTFILEPEITGKASLGYEHVDLETGEEIPFASHAGIDESGKGDFFGPLVISCVYVEKGLEQELVACGVKDSKAIKKDQKIQSLARSIRDIVQGKFSVVPIGPDAYNRLYENIGNLNRLLAWGHARALENLLEKAPECTEVLADKFGNEKLIENALMKKGRQVTLRQQTKAERDVAVAAASILARDEFIRRMDKLGELAGIKLPRGASKAVEEAAVRIIRINGPEQLPQYAKMHFRTAPKVLSMAGGR